MKTFQDYISLKELATYNVDDNFDDSNQSSSDPNSEKAFSAAMQAFEMVMSKNSKAASQFLNHMSELMPEIKSILQQHGLDSFKDGNFKNNSKNRKLISKGLADVSPDDVKDHDVDVLATNSADSFHNPIG
jgi:hypothetical protein